MVPKTYVRTKKNRLNFFKIKKLLFFEVHHEENEIISNWENV